jgi:hypothetical protein
MALESLNESMDIPGAWNDTREYIKTSARLLGCYELKQNN